MRGRREPRRDVLRAARAELVVRARPARRAVADPLWQGFGTEIYLAVGAIYLVFCHAMSRYSAGLHRSIRPARRE